MNVSQTLLKNNNILSVSQIISPVITSNTFYLPEVVGNSGITIDPSDLDVLTDEIYQILIIDSLRSEIM
jgi:glycosyltransferase involved in cell wall biosynthesis